MRSGLIFAVSEKFSNRYMLCRMLAASARKMHRDGVSTSQSINRSLQVLHGVNPADAASMPVEVTVAVPDKIEEKDAAEALVP